MKYCKNCKQNVEPEPIGSGSWISTIFAAIIGLAFFGLIGLFIVLLVIGVADFICVRCPICKAQNWER